MAKPVRNAKENIKFGQAEQFTQSSAHLRVKWRAQIVLILLFGTLAIIQRSDCAMQIDKGRKQSDLHRSSTSGFHTAAPCIGEN